VAQSPHLNRHRPRPSNRQPLDDRDWLLIAVCVAIAIASVAIVIRYFDEAFPQAAIDFRVDRTTSRKLAENVARGRGLDLDSMKHAARFESDETARIFLERSLGLAEANVVMAEQVRVWSWRHRWFTPLVEEELSVDIAPSGDVIGFDHRIPEDRAVASGGALPLDRALAFLRSIAVDTSALRLIEQSERQLPKRTQTIFTWESATVRPAGAQYRHIVTVDGGIVTSYSQRLKVPETWIRSYRELRSKNSAAGSIDLIFNAMLMVAAVIVFVVRLRRGDLSLRFLLGIGIASALLVGGVAANSMPAQLAWYDTTTSYPAFIGQLVFQAAMQSLGTAMLLIVVCGAGEVLYRERLPRQLAMPRIWQPRALASKRVFLALVLGYALVPLFIAYQVVFYLTAHRFGAWAPAEVPYDEMLNSALPWVAVLFAGFFPAFSEEFLSRAFAIPFIQRVARSRMFAILLAGFIWGFGHSTYPNQPFWIRGVEVGLVGVVAGLLMDRFGLLPLLIWHYTIDAVYTATLLFGSGNTYYIASASVAALVFAVPLVVSIALYFRNRGFIPDDDLTNATLPTSPPPEKTKPARGIAPLPPAIGPARGRVAFCAAVALLAAAAAWLAPRSPQDAIDYRIDGDRAKEIARAHVASLDAPAAPFAYVVASPVEGFRSWNRNSTREEGGVPGGFDEVAATWLVRNGFPVESLMELFRTKIEAGNWVVRFFTPMEKREIFVEIHGTSGRVVGYHKYQDEQTTGAALAQQDALGLARSAFPRYELDANAFELKEALSFQQPKRRDWLFHFDESNAIRDGAHRRVSVRVAGAEVTQFSRTIKVPEAVYREAETQTLLNVLLFAVKLIGLVTIFGLVIGGLVLATRSHGLPWRRPLRWTLILSVIPIAAFAARIESLLFGYSTTVAWDTFRVGLITSFVRDVGLQAGLMFLALAGLEATVPYAMSLTSIEARRRFGRAAAIGAATALALIVLADVAARFVAHLFPATASVAISAPSVLAIPLPAAITAAQAFFGAIIVSAAVALYAGAFERHAALITIAAVFCALVDPLATTAQAPLMLARAALLAALVWVIGRHVLGRNPLAWPLAVFLGSTLQTAETLLRNHRPDLVANGIALIAIAIAAAAWAVWPRPARAS
jgi:membrane protease YdiL (CAAX protease family)